MAEQVRKRNQAPGTETREEAPTRNGKLTERATALKKNIDDILGDIDDILEENAEEFVKEYVQRGGE
jgi:prokaryotic ubiquitin-like protein Pup